MKHILLASAALAAMAVAGSAAAEQANGWYVAADLGYNWKSDYKARSQGAMPDGGAYIYDVATHDDWAGFARLGYRYSPSWRVEFEGGYRPGDISSATSLPASIPSSNVTRLSTRRAGSNVVSRSSFGFISPRPLKRLNSSP